MGKAFTEEEKEKIKIRIMEEGVRLFHENGNKALSIRELTERVGISQGGFYSFFSSKEDLVLEIVKYRTEQKMDLFFNAFVKLSKDPVSDLCKVMSAYMIDIADKAMQKQMYSDMIHLVVSKKNESNHCDDIFKGYLLKLKAFWESKGLQVEMDFDGIWSLVSTVCVLVDQKEIYPDQYMNQMLELIIDAGIRKYIQVK